MFVHALSLRDFRSWSSAEIALEPGTTVFVGRNGNGKTNLIEALGYLATMASHRVATEAPMIRNGAASATVGAQVINDGRELRIDVQLNRGAANRASINRSPVRRTREILGVLRTVLFAPEDLSLVRGDPGERRRFLDELLTTRRPRMAALRSDYEKVLRQRAALLKTAYRSRGELSTLDVWDGHLANHGAALIAARLSLVHDLAPHVTESHARIAPGARPATLHYRSCVAGALPEGFTDPTRVPLDNDVEVLTHVLLDEMSRVRSSELERGVCLVGPHRDDLDLVLGTESAKGYASHGESWSFALALRIAAFALLRTDGSDPVLLLDDVFAELDMRRRMALAELVSDAEQVLVTAAVPEDVPEQLKGRRIGVVSDFDDGGRISRISEYPAEDQTHE
ncbi:MAG: DNA replication/repair protein RecF [Nocardiaceae bacterium]|nr:DNA replication/repair protein RecF [Nocardiaceae bacterium]